MTDLVKERVNCNIKTRNHEVPYGTQINDIANQIAVTIYNKKLTACLGTAQQLMIKKLKNTDIIVYIPKKQVTPTKFKKNSKKCSSKKYGNTKKNTTEQIRDKKNEITMTRIISMVNHAKSRGISIKIVL